MAVWKWGHSQDTPTEDSISLFLALNPQQHFQPVLELAGDRA